MAKALDLYDIYHGSDVLAVEPMQQEHPYFSVKAQSRLMITPHTAWASSQARETLVKEIVNNIESIEVL